MDFAFTEEQQMIRDTAAAFLAEVSDSAAVRTAMVTDRGWDETLWQRICDEMYWQALHIPEEFGGMGLGYVELAAILEEMGAHLLCSPFLSTVCFATNALLVAGTPEQQAMWLPQIVAGKTATLAWRGEGRDWSAGAVSAAFEKSGDGYTLNGEYRYVPDGHTADFLIVAAICEGEVALFVLPADSAGVSREWLPTMDQTRKQAQISLAGVKLDAASRLNGGAQALDQILDLAAIAVAAEQLGGAQRALDISVDYTKERVQFGRTIASYQAIKHRAADMMLKTEAARSAVYYAACIAQEALSHGPMADELAEAASIAKAYCSDAYYFNAGCGIQLHGGVGFTEEYDIQLYFKRAKSSETLLGDSSSHRERIAALLLD